ncbi:MAG: hypothetical protein C0501_08515 [Isosphaera sp.]|nr:hypothetical protein [Isosphaera sp.]
MKRSRVGLVGVGVAALAGAAVGSDGEWRPARRPDPPAHVATAAPALLPAEVRVDAADPEPRWFPAAPRVEVATPLPPLPVPKPVPVAVPARPVQPIPPPRSSDSPVEPVRPMPKPTPPPGVLPAPRPETPPPADLPVAPPELMTPAGWAVPHQHAPFGSPPVRLGRDYPSFWDLLGGSVRDKAGPADGPPRGYVSAEYLLWWMRDLNVPVLGTTNTAGGLGFLGEPGTAPVLGPGEFLGSFRQGFRVRGGYWFGEHGSCAVDAGYFFLGRRTADTVLTSDRFPTITRPVFSPNPAPGGGVIGETGEAVTIPGLLTGSLSARAESELWGADVNLRKCLASGCDSRLTGFVGYRHLNLSESLTVTENINVVGAGAGLITVTDPVGTVVVVQDRFETRNEFHGGQLGLTYERRRGRLALDLRTSVALGVTHQELEIDGFQRRVRPGMAPMGFRGGLLAAGPNLGTFTRDRFSVVPEATVNLGYFLTPSLKAFVGYNVLYWTDVIRPGDQVDRVVDLTFVPNAPAVPPSGRNRPRPLFRQSDLLVTGVQFGLEYRW